MAQRTDEQLIRSVGVERDQYEPEAIIAAEHELEKRGITPETFEQIQEAQTDRSIASENVRKGVVGSWVRLLQYVIDKVVLFVLTVIIAIIYELIGEQVNPEGDWPIAILFVVVPYFAYYVFMESFYQQTIGKMLLKTKVVMEDGSKPNLNTIFIRTAFRFIPADTISYIFTKRGFHDFLSHTYVVKHGES